MGAILVFQTLFNFEGDRNSWLNLTGRRQAGCYMEVKNWIIPRPDLVQLLFSLCATDFLTICFSWNSLSLERTTLFRFECEYLPQDHAFEHLVPRWWSLFGEVVHTLGCGTWLMKIGTKGKPWRLVLSFMIHEAQNYAYL